MPTIMEIKKDVMIALKSSYSDIIEIEEEIAIRFERIIEFLSHTAQSDRFYKQENRALCQCLETAAGQEQHLINKHLDGESDALYSKRARLLELKQKVENIY